MNAVVQSVLRALFVVVVTGGVHAGDENAPEPEPKSNALDWCSPKDALAKAGKEKLPIFLVWAGKAGETFWEDFDRECSSQNGFAERAKKFVLVRVDSSDAESIADSIGALGEKSAIVLLDFQEQVLWRWSGEVPRRTPLFKEMARAHGRNAELARKFRDCEERVEKARYAIVLKEYRKAVLLLLEAEKLGLPPASAPVKLLAEARAALDELYRAADAVAAELEEKKKYDQALAKYNEMRENFPFPERLKELDRKIARVESYLGRNA